jgi:hypothetical protein
MVNMPPPEENLNVPEEDEDEVELVGKDGKDGAVEDRVGVLWREDSEEGERRWGEGRGSANDEDGGEGKEPGMELNKSEGVQLKERGGGGDGKEGRTGDHLAPRSPPPHAQVDLGLTLRPGKQARDGEG